MTDDLARRALTQLFAELGAADPEAWARSQLDEGIPQLARYLFLRAAWRLVLGEDDRSWIDGTIAASARAPGAPLSGLGPALERLRAAGARDEDLTEVARGMQVAALFGFCHLLDEAPHEEPEVADVRWALVQVTPEGNIVGQVTGLHESVLETDPTGREMRPRA